MMTIAILVHALLFLVFWLTNLPYVTTLNNFLITATGLQANFLLIFVAFAGLVALWSALRLALRRDVRRTGPAWFYLAIGIFFLVFFYGSFIVLFLKNSVQLYRLGQMFQYFRLFVDAGVLLVLAWGLRRWAKGSSGKNKVLVSAGLLILWLIPVFCPPGNIYRSELPEKPLLIGHRGASTLAPENTMASMRTAADLGVYGVESDIDISSDGVLFLMHDSNLARTTNVALIFPGRQNVPAERFPWDELTRLDAGSWFAGATRYPGEPIPTLAELLQLVHGRGLHFVYDLRIPKAGQPYADQTLDLCLEEIKSAGIVNHTWILTGPEGIDQIRAILPDAILTFGIGYGQKQPSPATLVAQGYRVVNSVFGLSGSKIRAYQDAGLWVNLWVVDEAWQYSRLWLVGADSVTSNTVQTFIPMTRPVMGIPFATYMIIWVVVGLLAVAVYYFSTGKARRSG